MKKAERDHYNTVVKIGCIVCLNNGHPGTPAEIHHLTGAGMALKADYMKVIPLCPTHHRSGDFGVAIHNGTRTWEHRFGTQEDLLAQVETMADRIKRGLI